MTAQTLKNSLDFYVETVDDNGFYCIKGWRGNIQYTIYPEDGYYSWYDNYTGEFASGTLN